MEYNCTEKKLNYFASTFLLVIFTKHKQLMVKYDKFRYFQRHYRDMPKSDYIECDWNDL